MLEAALSVVVIAAAILYGAWREFADRNRRDAALLGAIGGATALLGAAVAGLG